MGVPCLSMTLLLPRTGMHVALDSGEEYHFSNILLIDSTKLQHLFVMQRSFDVDFACNSPVDAANSTILEIPRLGGGELEFKGSDLASAPPDKFLAERRSDRASPAGDDQSDPLSSRELDRPSPLPKFLAFLSHQFLLFFFLSGARTSLSSV